MICAYDKVYLDKARTALGRMLDFAVYDLAYDIAVFLTFSSNQKLHRGSKAGILRCWQVCPVLSLHT